MLDSTGSKAQDRYQTLHVRSGQIPDDANVLVLPVQTQAFGFAPAFRAIIGADLDRQLENAGIHSSRQTDVLDAYGPYVRRLEDASLHAFATQHPRQKLIVLYLGHDGATHAFMDLMVIDGADKHVAHKTLDLPQEPLQAVAALSAAVSNLLRDAGVVRSKSSRKPDDGEFACTAQAWELEELPRSASEAQIACRALVVGTLLPDYDTQSVGLGRMSSAAKLAWLAQAYAIAQRYALRSESAKAVRDLSLSQLEIATADTPPMAYIGASDPVVSRVSQLMTVWARSALAPTRSQRDQAEKFLEVATQGLPDFAHAVAVERSQFWPAFRQVDFCEIEHAFVGPVMRSRCEGGHGVLGGVAMGKPPRPASRAEALLYQEWLIASAYKDLVHFGLTLGLPDRLREAVRAMPADVASHPFIQRILYRIAVDAPPQDGETFDELLARKRQEVRRFVQSTINLQINDHWLHAWGVAQKVWTRNTYIRNDEQIRRDVSAERKLLSVMAYDRFSSDPSVPTVRRVAGEPAYFLMPDPPLPVPVRLTGAPVAASQAVVPALQQSLAPHATATQSSLSDPEVPLFRATLFTPQPASFEQPSRQALQVELQRNPTNMRTRVRLGGAMLKDGIEVSEVVNLLQSHPVDQRDDESLRESNTWSMAAHLFYLPGEAQAARIFYDRVRGRGDGSDADMLADVRVKLIDGQISQALQAAQARVDRYDSDYARRDLMGLQFMTGNPTRAWALFMSRAVAAETIEFWFGAAVGHRIQGLSLAELQTWIEHNKLNRVQLDSIDVSFLYLHMMAVMDRVPSDADIKMLHDIKGYSGSTDGRWAMSAMLVQGALGARPPQQTYARVTQEAAADFYLGGDDSLLPLYVWTAAQANKQDPYLDDVRKVTLGRDMNHLLAKSMLLCTEGNVAESLKFLKAARYEMGGFKWGQDLDTDGYWLPLQYQFALAGYLMYRKTGVQAYRQSVLQALDGFERTYPYFSWTYNLQALLEPDKKKQALAVCRGRFLDPHSYFLSQVRRNEQPVCPAVPW